MTGTFWIVSYIALWIAVIGLSVAVVALLRQIGLLHLRVAPMGVHFAGEGPTLDDPAPNIGRTWRSDGVTLVAFTSATCELCADLHPGLVRLADAEGDLDLVTLDGHADASAFASFSVRSTPYVVAIDADGIVRGRGVANTLDQVEEMLEEVRAGVIDLRDIPSTPTATTEATA